MKTRSAALAVVGVLAGTMLVPGIARADAMSVTDADDVRGRLDIKKVSHGHSSDASLARHRIVTYGNWRKRALKGDSFISLYISTDDEDQESEYRVGVNFQDGQWKGCLQIYIEQGSTRYVGAECHEVQVRRPNRHTLVMEFDPSVMRADPGSETGAPVDSYKWSANTYYVNPDGRYCRSSCEDWAPNGGRTIRGQVDHQL